MCSGSSSSAIENRCATVGSANRFVCKDFLEIAVHLAVTYDHTCRRCSNQPLLTTLVSNIQEKKKKELEGNCVK